MHDVFFILRSRNISRNTQPTEKMLLSFGESPRLWTWWSLFSQAFNTSLWSFVWKHIPWNNQQFQFLTLQRHLSRSKEKFWNKTCVSLNFGFVVLLFIIKAKLELLKLFESFIYDTITFSSYENILVLCEKWLSKFSSYLYVLRSPESEIIVFTKGSVCP